MYSIDRFVRRAEDVIDEVLRDQKAKQRPGPQHKDVWAEMTRKIDGIEVTAKEGLFCQLYAESIARNLGHDHSVICILDGERALWDAVGRPGGVLPRGGGHPGPIPRAGEDVCPTGGARRSCPDSGQGPRSTVARSVGFDPVDRGPAAGDILARRWCRGRTLANTSASLV